MLPSRFFVTGPRAALLTLSGCLALLVATVAIPSLLVSVAPPVSPELPPSSVEVRGPAPPPVSGEGIEPAPTQPILAEPELGGDDWIDTLPPRSITLPPPPAPPAPTGNHSQAEQLAASASQAAAAAISGRLPTISAPDRSPSVRRQRVEQFGGNVATETAVDAGLNWLAAHQSPDGLWRRMSFPAQCPGGDRCAGVALARLDVSLDEGLTGLVLLAFLGAGYTDRDGPHQHTVAAAVEALLRAQHPHGGFSPSSDMAGYNDALALFALAELYAMVRDERLRDPLARGVRRLVGSQQPLGGWDYLPDPGSGRNDTSITAWCVQALQSAAAAGIEVPASTLARAALHFARATGPDGRVWYADHGNGFRLDRQTLQPVYRYGPAMAAAGLTCETLLGWSPESAVVRRQLALLLNELPSASLLQGRDPTQLHAYYYWYYGTIAAFQLGGAVWERWNAALRDAILPLQERSQPPTGRKTHAFGSWPPYGTGWGKWGRMGGRVYTTAISVLTLETYYRHTPAYLQSPTILTAADWRAFLRDADPRQQQQAVPALAEMRLEIGEPALLELTRSGAPSAAVAAAVALASLDSPAGLDVLERALASGGPWQRAQLERAVQRCRERLAGAPLTGRVRFYDVQRRMATLDLPGAYADQVVEVLRDGQAVARGRILRRYTGSTITVAQVIEEGAVEIAAGDEVRAERRP